MSDETQAANSEVRAGQRIAKVIARAGVCSRRDAEAWIAEGRVSVNGKVLSSPAFNVSEADDVRVDGKPLGAPERTRLFLFHKPRGLVTTARDPEGARTRFSRCSRLTLPRVVAIGRLDINTEGLLLLTNDGGLARVLELPSTGWLRRYRVRAHGSIDQAALDRLERRRHDRRRRLSGRRGQARPRAGRERLAHAGPQGRQEPGDQEDPRASGSGGQPPDPRFVRPVRAWRSPRGRGHGSAHARAARPIGREARQGGERQFRRGPDRARRAARPSGGQGERPRGERGPREARGRGPAKPGRPERGARGAESRFERDGPARRAPPKPSTPERRRKHVSALRAEIVADVSDGKGPRKRVERGATHDRKGRTVAVERMSRAGEEARSSAARPKARRERASARPERWRRFLRPQARARRGRARAAAAFGPEGVRAPAREVQCRERRRRPAGAPLRPSSSEAGRRPPRWPAANAQYRGSDARTQV